jgi:monoamine oxidase
VRVTVKSRGSLQTVEADHLICAIPTTMLASVDLAGALSEAKIDAIKAVGYDTASRVFLETRRRFWEDEKLNGFGFGDDAAEVWNSTFGETGTHGILQTYLRGGFSRDLTGLSEPERIQYTTKKLSVLFPQLKGNTVGGVSKCWSEDPWVKGAWAHISPNSADLIRSPERRIYFAGEHLSGNPSWMQGALESGLRAVSEISISTAAVVRSI